MSDKRDRLTTRLGLAGILAAGLGLRFLGIDRQSLWLDEAVSWHFSHMPLRVLWTQVLDTHPPLYYALLRLWRVFGESETALRSFSALCGVLAVWLAFVLGRRVADERVGLVAAALVASSPLQLFYSQEARSYELLTVAALIASIGLVGILRAHADGRHPSMADCCLYVGGMVLALYAHNIAMLLLLVAGSVGTLDLVRHRSRDVFAVWAATMAVIVGCWSYWLPVVWRQSTGALPELAWLPPPNLITLVQAARDLYGQGHLFAPLWTTLLCLALAAAGAWLQRRAGLVLFFLLAAGFGIPLLEIVISGLGRPIFMTRTIIWVGPLYFVLVAAAVSRMGSVATLCVAGLLAVIQLMADARYEHVATKADWRAVAAAVATRACPGDVVVLEPYYIELPFTYYFHQGPVPVRVVGAYPDGPNQPDGRHPPNQIHIHGHDQTILSAPRVWMIVDQRFVADAAPIIARLAQGHARGVSLVTQDIRLELFSAAAAACAP